MNQTVDQFCIDPATAKNPRRFRRRCHRRYKKIGGTLSFKAFLREVSP